MLTTIQVLHVLFGAAGVMLLARARGMSHLWAAVAAIAYLFFGGFYGQAEHADAFRGFAYLPWLLWALTPPDGDGRWGRLAAAPLLVWLVATCAYPSQLISFSIAGAVYVIVALSSGGRESWRRHGAVLALAALASAAVCAAVLAPYLRADGAGQLIRTNQPTAAVRSMFAISPLDLLGLYLNNFAWTAEGTLTTWAIGVPVLVGLACARRATLARQAPLIACGAVALALGMGPKIGFVGRAMASVGVLFPSRFPALDYKAIVALAAIVVSVDAWSRVAAGERRSWLVATLAACALLAGVLLAPDTYAQPTREVGLVTVVVLASAALVLARLPARALACALIALVVVDGLREINDYRLGGTASPWHAEPSTLAYYYQRDAYVRGLPALLARAPIKRPARVPQDPSPEVNASGWVGDGYRATDYNPLRARALWQAEDSTTWSKLLLYRWLAVTFPCATVGCTSGAVHLPPLRAWRISTAVHTVSYGADSIVYAVKLAQPALMIENELAIDGWHARGGRVRIVDSGTPMRSWRLPAGTYEFTASFQEPGRARQELLAALALVAWLGCALATSGILARRRTAEAAQ